MKPRRTGPGASRQPQLTRQQPQMRSRLARLPHAAPPARRQTAAAPRGGRWIYGRHPVAAALANPERRWRRLVVLASHRDEAEALVAAAGAEHAGEGPRAPEIVDRAALDLLLPEGAAHQGWAIEVEPLPETDLGDVIRAVANRGGRGVIVLLDQVTDPHNVGAILRSAAAFGAVAVVVPRHGAPPATGALAKAASGGLDRVPLVRPVNLARALEELKEAGFWCCGLDATATSPLATLDLGAKVALVLGSEGGGLRRLVRERCDFLARLPTRPELPSLNVSNAAAIALYELARAALPG